ncbi:hypothetical protein AC579_2035 [Pseudocercospora musae]|uniref:Uncharacterized protein n=1 Tax=Pseudocercospora musae TaxID=113226 RepID=A0A139IR96_9PEZI|nr:hypothetical protein AC579_2035 [Pseudocercospora musae]
MECSNFDTTKVHVKHPDHGRYVLGRRISFVPASTQRRLSHQNSGHANATLYQRLPGSTSWQEQDGALEDAKFANRPVATILDLTLGVADRKSVEKAAAECIPQLPGNTLAWLTAERRSWLRNRCTNGRLDMREFGAIKEEVVRDDLLRSKLSVGGGKSDDVGHSVRCSLILLRCRRFLATTLIASPTTVNSYLYPPPSHSSPHNHAISIQPWPSQIISHISATTSPETTTHESAAQNVDVSKEDIVRLVRGNVYLLKTLLEMYPYPASFQLSPYERHNMTNTNRYRDTLFIAQEKPTPKSAA